MSIEIRTWLGGLGLGRYERIFSDNDIDAEVLPDLTEGDLEKLGVSLGHRKKLLKAIGALAAPETALPLHTERADRGAERRQLTVMFCDLVGSTALSERLDLEDYREVISVYQATCSAAVESYQGYVARYLGDGLLVYFGYPQAHEDDAERAVRASLQTVSALRDLESIAGRPLEVRIGIATGWVVAGDIVGTGRTEEHAVLGETPNLAARLQSLATPGGILISTATRRLTGRLFACDDAGEHDLKGFSRPVGAWRVVSVADSRSRFEATRSADATPLIGREAELALLLDRWRRAEDAEGQVVLLSGEPGVGKSRLAYALLERVDTETASVVKLQCSPYHLNSAFYPFIAHIRSAAGIEGHSTAEPQHERLQQWLAAQGLEVGASASLLYALVSNTEIDRAGQTGLDPLQQKKETIQALTAWMIAHASDSPKVVLFEDLHWADPTTLEVIASVVEAVGQSALLFVATHRPGFVVPWLDQGHVTCHTLARLGRRQAASIVECLAGNLGLPATLVKRIVDNTDGVPLFVEELTKTVIEDGASPLRPALRVPSTLRDSLVARLDRLGDAKQTAQIAAVVGREFRREILQDLSPLDTESLRVELGRLVEAGLVYALAGSGEESYCFKHALVQDAAYESLLRAERQELHAGLAQALARRFPEKVAQEPELLAHHYTEAGLGWEALCQWQEAAEQAMRRSAYPERLAHLDAALGLLDALPEDPRRPGKELELQIARGGALMVTEGFRAVSTGEAFARAHQLAEQAGDRRRAFAALRGLHGVRFTRAELDAGLEAAEGCLQIAGESAEQQHLSLAHRLVGQTLQMRGDLVEAREHLEQARRLVAGPQVDDVAPLVSGGGHRLMVPAFLAQVVWLQGYPDQALALAKHGLRRAEEAYGAFDVAACRFFLCWIHGWRGEYPQVTELAQRIRSLAGQYRIAEWIDPGGLLADWQNLATGETDARAELSRHRLESVRRLSGVMTPFKLGILAGALEAHGADDAIEVIDEALTLSGRGERWSDAELLRIKGKWLFSVSRDPSAGEFCLQESLRIARKQGAKSWELRTATTLAELRAGQGRHGEARELLEPVRAWFTEGFETADLKQSGALLGSLQ